MSINVHSQADMHFDFVGGITITWGQHLLAQIVVGNAIHCVEKDLLLVLGESSQAGTSLVRVSFQDKSQSILAQASRSSLVKQTKENVTVPVLLNKHVLVQAESDVGVEKFEKFPCIGVVYLSGNPR